LRDSSWCTNHHRMAGRAIHATRWCTWLQRCADSCVRACRSAVCAPLSSRSAAQPCGGSSQPSPSRRASAPSMLTKAMMPNGTVNSAVLARSNRSSTSADDQTGRAWADTAGWSNAPSVSCWRTSASACHTTDAPTSFRYCCGPEAYFWLQPIWLGNRENRALRRLPGVLGQVTGCPAAAWSFLNFFSAKITASVSRREELLPPVGGDTPPITSEQIKNANRRWPPL
jgi:hypothetical protein